MTRKNEKQKLWTPADEKILLHLRVEGASAVTIAEVLGRKVSAIETKIARLKLPRANKKPAPPVERPTAPKRHPHSSIAYGTPKPMLDLRERECRFFVDGQGFCAAACEGPYCTAHAKICYV